ncbi:hypothetical protein ACM61V_18645 [Sphingomonas sp. TX0543]|uniref:hypothetical protein n=1 Tax=Sphingomonas sp. TX0543 TaxID=3399682 RepID=UPI003AFB4359
MKLLVRSALLAGIAALAVAGTALAGNFRGKVMTVNLPDGLIARVEYQGDVAPKVTVEPPDGELEVAWSGASGAPFTMLDRISGDLDRQFDTMVRQVRLLEALPTTDMGLANWPSAQALPANATRYSYVATSTGKGFCARSMEIISEGPHQKPRITTSTSGDCVAGSAPPQKPTASAHNT